MYYTIVCHSLNLNDHSSTLKCIDDQMIGVYETSNDGKDFVIKFSSESERNCSYSKVYKMFGESLEISLNGYDKPVIIDDGEEFL